MAKNEKKTEKATRTATAETTVKPEKDEKVGKTYNEAELQAAIAAAVKEALESAAKPVISLAKDEYVTVLFVGAIARGTTVALGKLGQITQSGGTLDIPKRDFLANLGLPTVDALLRKRQLIVIGGLTQEEMERFGLNYKESELLSQRVYFKIFDYPTKELCEIYKKLCPEHKKIVAKMFLSKYFDEHDARVTPDTVKALNKISREVYPDGLFSPIISDMAQKFEDKE